MATVLVLVVALLLAVLRAAGHKSQAYQAVAHLFVGLLLGAWWVGRDQFLLNVAIGLSIVEVIAFLWFKFHKRG